MAAGGFDFARAAAPRLVQADGSALGGALPHRLAWSPDGVLLLASGDDSAVSVLGAPRHTFVDVDGCAAGESRSNRAPLALAARVREADALRDAAWHPRAASSDPATALFFTAAKDQPVQLRDCASPAAPRASYVATNHSDEVVGAHSVACSRDGGALVGGYDRLLLLFHAGRPGHECARWPTTPTRASKGGQRGIISSVAFAGDDAAVFAAGCFDGSVAAYDTRTSGVVQAFTDGPPAATGGGGCEAAMILDYRPAAAVAGAGASAGASTAPAPPPRGRAGSAPRPAVTQVSFTPDGRHLCVGFRRHCELRVWDARKPAAPALRCYRDASSNQRLQFSVDSTSRWLASGSRDGRVALYDLLRGEAAAAAEAWVALPDAVACVALHPMGVALATATGERRRRASVGTVPSVAQQPRRDGTGGGDAPGVGVDADDSGSSDDAPPPRPRAGGTIAVWRACPPGGAELERRPECVGALATDESAEAAELEGIVDRFVVDR